MGAEWEVRLLFGSKSIPKAYPMDVQRDGTFVEITRSLSQIESNLVEYIEELTKPLFALFDFLEVPEHVYQDIANGFAKGELR
ncbi:MAG TPA: hypothetical protein DDZ66_05410 [Firmicutes bacterium]|jgi:hypothetical protein|nr:hypothetical protein [Bacillota bacterium]